MDIRILKGTVVSAPVFGRLDAVENGYIVAKNGRIVGVFQDLPEEYQDDPVEDYGNCLLLQSFSDMHLHGPQFPMLGMGMDRELLGWLENETWPTEAKFRDPAYAAQVYEALARELVKNGTTRVCMFASLHKDTTLLLMQTLQKAGITGFVGKVNMDRNGGKDLQETTQGSMEDTLAWLDACRDLDGVKPILTPRFSPSCTEPLMSFLGDLARERDLPVQSHLSESRGEIAWVKELFPDCKTYYETYKKHGLWTPKTLMAHCVWSDEEELLAMKAAGVTVVHCADSNSNLRSGVAPVRKMLDLGVSVVLGSDISGGDQLNVFDILNSTIKASKLRSAYDPEDPRQLTAAEAWYLATSQANVWFGEQPGFGTGNLLQLMVIDDSRVMDAHPMTAQQRLERLIYRRQENALKAVYCGSRKLY